MSDITLDNINLLENKVYELGLKICQLLEKIKDYMNGDNLNPASQGMLDTQVDLLLKNLFDLKEEMHRRVDEIYKENNYSHLVKLQSDLSEHLNVLSNLRYKLKNTHTV
jgi:hypothetical protein